MKEKLGNLDSPKINNFSGTDNIMRMKRQGTGYKNNICKVHIYKGHSMHTQKRLN